jgi:hypothetical protein
MRYQSSLINVGTSAMKKSMKRIAKDCSTSFMQETEQPKTSFFLAVDMW